MHRCKLSLKLLTHTAVDTTTTMTLHNTTQHLGNGRITLRPADSLNHPLRQPPRALVQALRPPNLPHSLISIGHPPEEALVPPTTTRPCPTMLGTRTLLEAGNGRLMAPVEVKGHQPR